MKRLISSSSPRPRMHPAVLIATGLLALLSPAHSADKPKKTPMLRIVCPSTLGDQTEYTLAAKDEKGNWRTSEKLELRPSYISNWIEAPQGELGICVLEDKELVSKWNFTFAEGTRRALVFLLPGEADDRDTAPVIDTDQQAFAKGEILVVNSTAMTCSVKLGGDETVTKPGERLVLKPSPNEKDMYQMLITYTGEDGKAVTCHDRYLTANKNARDFLLLVPDPKRVVRILSLSDFGPIE